MAAMKKFFKDELGTSAVEYGLMFTLIAIFVVTAVSFLGTTLSAKFSSAAHEMSMAGS
jgi:pilus assembly protein Flp/PilA